VRGNKGELAGIPMSDQPERARIVYIGGAEFQVEHVWRHQERVVFKLLGVDSIDAAEKLAGADVAIPREQRLALDEHEYYLSDLIGCTVMEQGRVIGLVEDLHEYGAAPLLAVRDSNGREILIPFAKAICVVIDPAAKRIEIEAPEGLLDLE
jgi:16S rRNA processing protein RimM